MRKTFFILSLLGIVFLGSLAALRVFKNQVGDITPIFSPSFSTPTLPETLETPISLASPSAELNTFTDNPNLQTASYIQAPRNTKVTFFATNTPGARDLEFSPSGTLLVSLRKSGKVVALPDRNQDGQADRTVTILENVQNPHGLAFHDGKLFVAEETKVNRYAWDETNMKATLEKTLFDAPSGVTLPGGGGGHQTRSLVFDQKGNLYISLGSTCNVCEEKHPWLASVVITDAEGSNPRVFAKGLRNAVFLTRNPLTDQIWVTEMGRDHLGDDLPPEEINILQDNGDYGWPYCYGNKIYDQNYGKESSSYCQNTVAPLYEFQAHSAPLGLTFITSPQFPAEWQGDLLVAYHGSWNRSEPTGYKVVRLSVEGNTITGQEDFLTGFLEGNQAGGRPVDVQFDQQGNLYISDDKAGAVYRLRFSANL